MVFSKRLLCSPKDCCVLQKIVVFSKRLLCFPKDCCVSEEKLSCVLPLRATVKTGLGLWTPSYAVCECSFKLILKEVTPENVYFLSTLIKTLHLVQPLTEVSASKVQVFHVKFISKEAQNSNIVAAILNSTQQPGCVFVTSFRPRHFVQMTSGKPFDYPFGLWLL